MSVGLHWTQQDWNNQLYTLQQQYQQFCNQAALLAAAVAPYNAATLATLTGFSQADCTNLISGVNVANALAQLSTVNGTPAPSQSATASQAQVALGKFFGP